MTKMLMTVDAVLLVVVVVFVSPKNWLVITMTSWMAAFVFDKRRKSSVVTHVVASLGDAEVVCVASSLYNGFLRTTSSSTLYSICHLLHGGQ